MALLNISSMNYSIGDLVVDSDGYIGTVKYCGLIEKSPFPKLTWVGVEWKDSTRGKYDGSIYGTRYFECPPGAGSFVKPSQLSKYFELSELVLRRFDADHSSPHALRWNSEMILKRSEGDGRGAYVNITSLDMSAKNINGIGTSLSSICPNISDLDISSNDIRWWSEIITLLSQLPKLVFLNISRNSLSKFPDVLPKNIKWPKIETLILNDTNTTWKIINILLEMIPSITDLWMGGNNLDKVELDINKSTSLTGLSLIGNNITKWESVHQIYSLPNLKQLLLSKNPLENISIPFEMDSSVYFSSLAILSLDDTKLSNWDHIDALNRIPNLMELNATNLPIFGSTKEEDRRKLVIARLPKLKKLNRSIITAQERDAAERYFLRQHSTSNDKPTAYFRLKEKHGELQPLMDIYLNQSDPNIPVFFEGIEIPNFRLEFEWTLSEFRSHLCDALKHSPTELEIFHKSPYDFAKIGDGTRKLYSMRLMEGDELHIQLKQKSPPRPKRHTPTKTGAPLRPIGLMPCARAAKSKTASNQSTVSPSSVSV